MNDEEGEVSQGAPLFSLQATLNLNFGI